MGEVEYAPVTIAGHQLYVHQPCGLAETWINQAEADDNGCDCCDSAPDPGSWRPLYVHGAWRRSP